MPGSNLQGRLLKAHHGRMNANLGSALLWGILLGVLLIALKVFGVIT